MAYGSFGQMYNYVNRVFDLYDRFTSFTDPRRSPTIPLAPVLMTWFFAFVTRKGSTEQAGNMFLDKRWRKRLGLQPHQGGSPDRMGEILDDLSIEEFNAFLLDLFFHARRENLLPPGPYGQRCVILDLNELFKSEKIHCEHCQVRRKHVKDQDGNDTIVEEYYHQVVSLTWICDKTAWPIAWEIVRPGEGELTTGLRMLSEVLPQIRHSVDVALGDALYCCRPFFSICLENQVVGAAISSGNTEMDKEIKLLMENEIPRKLAGIDLNVWEMESEAWKQDLKNTLRVVHFERLYEAPKWKNERKSLRLIICEPKDSNARLPTRQAWKVGRARWGIENEMFNMLTQFYDLTHNFRHSIAAIHVLLVLRSLAMAITLLYYHFATARSKLNIAFCRWFEAVIYEDWVRFLDAALKAPQGIDSS